MTVEYMKECGPEDYRVHLEVVQVLCKRCSISGVKLRYVNPKVKFKLTEMAIKL